MEKLRQKDVCVYVIILVVIIFIYGDGQETKAGGKALRMESEKLANFIKGRLGKLRLAPDTARKLVIRV